MKTKKILSLLMVAMLMMSMLSVVSAKGELLPLNDYSTDNSEWTTGNSSKEIISDGGENFLKFTKTTQYAGKLTSAKFNTSAEDVKGIRIDFDVMQYVPEGEEASAASMTVLLNGAAPLVSFGGGKSYFTDKSAATQKGDFSANQWYSISLRINYTNGQFYGIVKDANGNVVHKLSFVQSSGYIKNEFAGKAESHIILQMGGSATGGTYYLDNTCISKLTDEDMAILPVSQTKILEENFDGATIGEATLSGSWDSKNEAFGMGGKGIFAGARDGKISIVQNGNSETDKILKLNLNNATQNYIEVMYYATQSGKAALVNEITFEYEKNITSMDVYYRGTPAMTVATLSFTGDKVFLGTNTSDVNVDFDFVPGKKYTVKTFYVMGESNQGKIEITDGEKSIAIVGDVNFNSTATSTDAACFRLWRDSQDASIENKVVTIYNYNLYSSTAEDCKLKYAYSDLKITADNENPNKYYASVEVEANTSYDNYINNYATFILTSYEGDRLKSVSLINVSPTMGRFTADVVATSADSKVKAMLWNMENNEQTPIMDAVTAGNWE